MSSRDEVPFNKGKWRRSFTSDRILDTKKREMSCCFFFQATKIWHVQLLQARQKGERLVIDARERVASQFEDGHARALLEHARVQPTHVVVVQIAAIKQTGRVFDCSILTFGAANWNSQLVE